MISALTAHICSGDEIGKIIFVSVDLILVSLCIHYVTKKDYETPTYPDIQAVE